MLLGTSCNLSQSSNQTSLLELCSDLRRKEFKDYDHLFISAEPQSYRQSVAVELTGFCNYEHSAFVINTDTCTDENNSTSCGNSLFRLFVNKTGRYNHFGLYPLCCEVFYINSTDIFLGRKGQINEEQAEENKAQRQVRSGLAGHKNLYEKWFKGRQGRIYFLYGSADQYFRTFSHEY